VVDQGGNPVAHSTSATFCSHPVRHPAAVRRRAVAPGAVTGNRCHAARTRAADRPGRPRAAAAAERTGKPRGTDQGRDTGIRPLEADDGPAVLSLPVHPGLVQERGTVIGGVIAPLAKSTTGAAVQTIVPAGTGFTALDLKVNFLRPARAEGDELVATGVVTHRGRRLSTANAVVT